MGMIESRTFKIGDDVVVHLPDALGIPADFAVSLEWSGKTVTMRPTSDDPESKRTWSDVLARLDAIGAVGEIGKRPPVDIPVRDGG